ncbi:MAG: hypothetical protein O3A63_18055 [Proteobacteria bacterium]|nr:hypothetical protein [Pseudomonadota bacterium]
MPTQIIATDHPLTPSEQQILAALLDPLLPATEDGRMPSAADLDLVGYLAESAPEIVPQLAGIVGCFDQTFTGLSLEDRYALVTDFSQTQPHLFEPLLRHTYTCYYQDERVLIGIGLSGSPPFPTGNTVEAGDLSLLDAVVSKTRSYRK